MALVLDGEVGDAAPRIEPVGGGEGVGRADIQAAAAGAAAVGLRLVGRELERREERAEEEPGAVAAGDQVGVLALPPQAGAGRQRLLHHRRRVHEELHLGPEAACDEAGEAFEPALQHGVVVAPLGIGRDDAARRLPQQPQRIVRRPVVEADRHHAARRRPERAGGAAPRRGARNPVHVPGIAQRDETPQRRAVRRHVRRARHACRLEAERAGLAQGSPHGRRPGRPSRSPAGRRQPRSAPSISMSSAVSTVASRTAPRLPG